ncbi:NAD-dependent epimerase/dehydratase family protein [Micromonospora parathelypteridis]|uniref:Nucleoside-diphosphate-sugar epimerase n=1 Tax=Micromonospora parathelypteridis TaxID=1839617 RepID=A0A840VVF6_9ACTN|nr:NAD(P)-dependent oxidoreductase [Micromonospora parathelypteridis]MBB5480715.1 nucleoside-diphosphate-sugar epimerase [Micromonospora parathelypteridis]GGO22021.1 dTDP-glucose 4,6-dehydratase [Micromonospora parathelypteridis]
MRIVLAGSTGVIGRRLEPLLSAQGHEVIGLARNGPIAVDVLDRDAVVAAVRDARPDVVMHQLTSLSTGDFAANSRLRQIGTRNLVDAALAAGVRRFVAQSIAWAYEPGTEPGTEKTPLDVGAPEPRQTTVAGISALEAAVQETPEWVVLRYGTLYGPGTWYARNGLMAQFAADGKVPADADVSSLLHIDDAVAAAVAALEWPAGAVNVCDDEPAAASEWVPAFCTAAGVPAPAATVGERHGWARGASNHYARTHLDWLPTYPSWREGFATL